jgi:MFS family permease
MRATRANRRIRLRYRPSGQLGAYSRGLRARIGAGAAGRGCHGAPDRIRTCDLRLRRPTLYPLSYRRANGSHNTRPSAPGSPAHPPAPGGAAAAPARVGWSLIEGIGACLVIPAIAALIAANYEGKQRALAYGIIGGVAAAAIAAGPLIGGWVTTTWTWRVVFAAETVVVIGILLFRKRMRPSPRLENPPSLDVVGAALSATALALIVIAVLQSSAWGWVQPIGAPEINGVPITPLGFSIVPFMILGGLALLWVFAEWEERRVRLGQDPLLDVKLLSIVTMRAGLGSMFMLQLVLLGTFFVLPVYFQTVLGLDAFETGLRLVPMSVTMLVCALAGPRVAARRSPRTVSRAGFIGMAIGATLVLANIDVTLDGWAFGIGLAIFGGGAGFLASQVGNVIMSSVPPERSNEAGGLQGTGQMLGGSFGTALIGAILLSGLTAAFIADIAENPAIDAETRAAITAQAEAGGLDIVTVEQAEQFALDAGLPPDQAAALAEDYGNALLDGLRNALGAVAVFSLLALWFTRRLPRSSTAPADEPARPSDAVAAAGSG